VLKNQIGVVVSIRNLISQASVLQQSLRSSLIVPVVTLGIVSGCSTNPELGDVPDNRLPTVPAELPPPPVPDAIGLILGGVPITRNSINDPNHPLSQRLMFFGYNSSQLTPEALDLARGHAEYLSRFSDVRVRVEGHTDERGSREYNIALGDNRSRSIANIVAP